MQADREHDLPGREVVRLYTTAELARILEVATSTVRGWMRAGLIKPVKEVKRLCHFDFQQLANARVLSRLSRQGFTPARIRAGLRRLGEWLPDGQGLGQLWALERRGPLLVRLDDGGLAETSGQLLLDFDAAQSPRPLAPSVGSRRVTDASEDQPARTTVDWFARGQRAEADTDLEAAAEAYEHALGQDYQRAETWFNLGNVLYSLERKADALRAFTRATGLCPEYVEAWNNLGNTLSEAGQLDDAVQAYEQALALEPTYMDAHYNLAETLDNNGQRQRAKKHWREYLRLDPNSKWGQRVRARIDE